MEWAVDTMIVPLSSRDVMSMLHANVPPMFESRSIMTLTLDVIPPLCPRSPEDVSNQKSEVAVLYWSLTYGTPLAWEWSSVPRMPRIASVSSRRCSSGLFLDNLLWVDSGYQLVGNDSSFLRRSENQRCPVIGWSCSLGVRASKKGCFIGIIATVVN